MKPYPFDRSDEDRQQRLEWLVEYRTKDEPKRGRAKSRLQRQIRREGDLPMTPEEGALWDYEKGLRWIRKNEETATENT